ncbi:MAG: hypothetical protein ACP5G2_01480 [Candidatus Bipolaricaulaceae bacterium]
MEAASRQADNEADLTPVLPLREVARVWWPLAASWLLMALEGPAISAIVARLVQPELHLAAYGGLVLPLSLFIEAPIIMLLAASTALSKDWRSYTFLRNFTHGLSAGLTLLHVLVVYTPLYYWVARGVIGAPPEIVEPGRWGLMIMVPWTWSIAYRRFNQGVLIRFGHSLSVGLGTAIRLGAGGIALAVGYAVGTVPGIVVAAAATIAGVVSEATFVGLRVRPVLRRQLRPAPPVAERLTMRGFLSFYVPLSLTPLIFLVARPIGSAAISRMPQALSSLAVWPVLTGLVFMLRSFGVSYNEVVVALLDRPRSSPALRKFAGLLTCVTTAVLLAVAATPLARLWFQGISGLSAELAGLAERGLWLALLLPALTVLQSWFQGVILHTRRTGAITEAVLLFFLVNGAVLAAGVTSAPVPGIYVAVAGLSTGAAARTGWLAWRSRNSRHHLRQRDLTSASR